MYRIHCKIMTLYLTVRNLRYWGNFHKTIMYTTTPRTEPDLLKERKTKTLYKKNASNLFKLERGLYHNLSKQTSFSQTQLFPRF